MHVPPVAPVLRRAAATGRRLAESWTGSPRALDVLTALSCLGLMALDLPGLAAADNSLSGPMAAVVLAAGCSSLVVRRRAPWVSYLIALLFIGWLHELTLIQFALYSVGRFRGRRPAVLATLGYIAFALIVFSVPGWPEPQARTLSAFLSLVVPIGVLASAVGIAAYRHDLVRELAARRAESAVLQAVQQERTSVARDVHDFVGRELTLLTVRSEVLSVRARKSAHAKDFEELADTARRAHLVLNEIIVQRGERAATPGVEGLPALAEESGRAGSPVRLALDPQVHGLSPLRQAAVYRVVQECLTNAAKHACGETIDVSIAADGPQLRIAVSNGLPARTPTRAPVSAGSGTASMSERVRSLGGTLTATRTEDSYTVVATLPRG
ncbi:histidine kinase [Streptomyces sp. NPDC048550]|uniref:sensor histidine kinase n=1 Tax=unclassified Streptomyces TaxID=2593676 RepID=UPI002252BE2C|nr:histidine kinase [Streptomyces sp. NBC_00320]MCX5147739.1 histidine kinase [Streptomyces sp. NBC_00320]WSW59693.1 histidine kinase [Streptomyces sp. NBC_00998]